MAFLNLAPFRFRDLPIEIRNKIYCEMLCDFKPQPTTVPPSEALNLAPALHDIHTAILATSKSIHREAYEVMVKTNRFVKVTSKRGLPIRLLLNALRVPIVAEGKRRVNNFRGYVLAVDLRNSLHPPRAGRGDMVDDTTAATDLMILHRDLDRFCQALTDGDVHTPGFSRVVMMNITVGPILDKQQILKPAVSFTDFFSETTQKSLLAPFRTQLHSLEMVTIEGYVGVELAEMAKKDISRQPWSDSQKVLTEFLAAKEDGMKQFQQGDKAGGCLTWQDAVVDIDKILESTSWPSLVEQGGESFILQLSQAYFLTRLNIAHVQIGEMETPGMGYYAGLMAEDALNSAVRSLKQDYWMRGYKYRPSIQHLAKLRFRFAVFMRLENKPESQRRAMTYIDGALQLQPNDSAIMAEKERIKTWIARGY